MTRAGFPKNQYKLHSFVKRKPNTVVNFKNNERRKFRNRITRWRKRKGYGY